MPVTDMKAVTPLSRAAKETVSVAEGGGAGREKEGGAPVGGGGEGAGVVVPPPDKPRGAAEASRPHKIAAVPAIIGRNQGRSARPADQYVVARAAAQIVVARA